MSGEAERLVNRIRELQGNKFKKISDELIQAEKTLELINEELEEETLGNAKQLVIDKLRADKLASMRIVEELKKRR